MIRFGWVQQERSLGSRPIGSMISASAYSPGRSLMQDMLLFRQSLRMIPRNKCKRSQNVSRFHHVQVMQDDALKHCVPVYLAQDLDLSGQSRHWAQDPNFRWWSSAETDANRDTAVAWAEIKVRFAGYATMSAPFMIEKLSYDDVWQCIDTVRQLANIQSVASLLLQRWEGSAQLIHTHTHKSLT